MGKSRYEAFSIVMAVYKNDRVDWFKQAVNSILNQTVKSNDIILVRDGEVATDLEKTLTAYEKSYKEVTVVRLGENVGAGQARNEGVSHAKNDLIAIMDADDISLPNRFKLQLAEFADRPDLSLVGGQISEFEGSPSNITGYRKVPTEYEAIKRFARFRSPINNLTIMFKKNAFLAVGGYPGMTRAEDYYMVSAMIAKSLIVNNISDVVVSYRVDGENIRRRKSWKAVRENIISRWKIYQLGVSSLSGLILSSIGQLTLFFMPSGVAKLMFKLALRRGKDE